MESRKNTYMNKPLSLLFLATLSCGAISLAAYSANKDNKPVANQTLATGNNTLTFDYRKGSTSTDISGTFNVSGGTITMSANQNGSTAIPRYDSTSHFANYEYWKTGREEQGYNQWYGAGTTFTLSGVTLTKVTFTGHGSYYAREVNYIVDGGSTNAGSWSSITMVMDGFHATTSFEFYNACHSTYQLRLDVIELEYISSTDFTAVEKFVDDNMHTEIPFDNGGKGLCVNWYIDAKKELVKLTDSQIDVFKYNSYFAKYHERYLSWADANHDTSPYEGNGIVLSNKTNGINKNNGNIGLLITSITSFSFAALSLSLLIYTDRKERE